ncbi:hypothetical protein CAUPRSCDRAFT_13225 [Caulochytrium protostelioides]|uniref:Cyclin N-terminal domain-containing protein n=1 Tax=Caulochytrium protostelioides TaxID=1555241 RepID=A0A4P9WSL3_9FUNG|nr:hypothetical protein CAUPRSCDRAFT_13225 [Caulochytrium protostelioides]
MVFDDAVSDASAHVDPEELLSEDRHPLPNGLVYGDRVPTPSEILNVLFRLFKAADLTADVGIITLIYLERLVERAQLRLRPRTWLRALLICVITASKVWDDNAVWNAGPKDK